MMMAKPQSTEETKASLSTENEKKTQSPAEAVEDLERRLALLGNPSRASAETEEDENLLLSLDSPPPYPSAPSVAEHSHPPIQKGVLPPAKAGGSGKNALLARIMAAQERAKQAGQSKDVPVEEESSNIADDAPPPKFDFSLLPPPAIEEVEVPPPPFDQVEANLLKGVTAQPPPAVVPSAPSYEDLLDLQSQSTSAVYSSPEEEIIMGMEGLSDEEKRVLLDEQRQIMEQIEREKAANEAAIAAAQADAFDSRSTSVVVRAAGSNDTGRAPASRDRNRKVNLGGGQEVALHGPERTKAAIKDGTAILVQCVNCENWMQVTANATLMYCPVCAVVSPVVKEGTQEIAEETEQMSADRKLAEQLQKEEYERGDNSSRAQRRERTQQQQRTEESSWWGTFSNMFTPVAKTEGQGQRVAEVASQEETNGLVSQQARVAERQPLFSCVVDSVSTAANSLGTALTSQTVQEDREGNVHGVDASSLLAVPQVSRTAQYSKLPHDA
uniref:Uncharacterized protein n=1 Tax=Cyclophora tenuis TaxID=216820 RepID=A0A7S1CY09_CYCTE|mmetsp:Transcript_14288/g.24258  ORF Transcript_14288/g.24258 Transcript_14288/m.24258 type:complete len:499 (+) Transcript_14288:26-1522(+)